MLRARCGLGASSRRSPPGFGRRRLLGERGHRTRGGGCGPGPGSGGFAPPHVGNRPKDPIGAGRGREGCSGLAAGRSEVKPPRGFGRAAERDYGILRKCACSGGFVRAGPGASGGAGSGAGPRGLCGAPGPRWGRARAPPSRDGSSGAGRPRGPAAGGSEGGTAGSPSTEEMKGARGGAGGEEGERGEQMAPCSPRQTPRVLRRLRLAELLGPGPTEGPAES